MPPRMIDSIEGSFWIRSDHYSNYIRLKDIPTIDMCCCEHKKEEKHMKKESQEKILILRDEGNPNKVIARDLNTGKKAEAVCAPADTFDFYTGAQLALDRLCTKKEPKYWTGKVICVQEQHKKPISDCDPAFTKGKVYFVNNGDLYDDRPVLCFMSGICSFDDMMDRLLTPGLQFIEFKGEA